MEIALVQQFLPSDPHEAFQNGLNALEEAGRAGADLVLFPELSFTPFYPRVPASDREETVLDLAEAVPGPTTEAIAEVAEQYGVIVVFNLLERDGDQTFDASPVIDADGTLLGTTRMLHITDFEHFHEQGYYAPGDTGAPVYDTAIGRLGVAICYDRHYPEYMRALGVEEAEIVVVPQAGIAGEWPEGMFEAELRVAAFQNGYFAALANRVGQEGEMTFAGGSFVADPFGRVVAQAPTGEADLLRVSVDLDRRREAPAHRLFLRDRRPDQYEGGAVRSPRSTWTRQ